MPVSPRVSRLLASLASGRQLWRATPWEARRPVYEASVPADFVIQQMRLERAKEGTKRSRYQEELRNRGGAYVAPANAPDFSARAA